MKSEMEEETTVLHKLDFERLGGNGLQHRIPEYNLLYLEVRREGVASVHRQDQLWIVVYRVLVIYVSDKGNVWS